jgi:hypothetical protein
MLEVLYRIFEHIDVNNFKWAVPLSGGYDSRAILMFLKSLANVTAITWGTKRSLQDTECDSVVAYQVAASFGASHKFFPLDINHSPEIVVNRFLVAGEGRIDHIAGYLDGFKVWQWLYEQGFDGVLRGDICWPHLGLMPQKPLHIRQNSSITLFTLSDFCNLPSFDVFDLPKQSLPEKYLPLEGESLTYYQDRLYQVFRMPVGLAALNDLKTAFVEIGNPFCSHRFIELARRLPDAVRYDKRLFKGIVEKKGPDIPIARRSATANTSQFLTSDSFMEFILYELDSGAAKKLFPAALLDFARKGIVERASRKEFSVQKKAGRVRRWARYVIGKFKGPQQIPPPKMNPVDFAMRTVLISRMCDLLKTDGDLLTDQ